MASDEADVPGGRPVSACVRDSVKSYDVVSGQWLVPGTVRGVCKK